MEVQQQAATPTTSQVVGHAATWSDIALRGQKPVILEVSNFLTETKS
jgi:hypothetical protein